MPSSNPEIILPRGHTGSSLFHDVLTQAAAQFTGALHKAQLPETSAAFKARYGHALARFEAARVCSPQRVEIARFIVQRTHDALSFGNTDEAVPLRHYMRERVAAPECERVQLPEDDGLTLEVPLDGRLYRGEAIHELVERLFHEDQLSSSARTALHWIVNHAAACGGALSLRGERFVLLGAGAELAPTELLLRAGASVLWVDVADPPETLLRASGLSGSLTRARAASNLLSQPREIAAAIRAFAEDGPVHIGMFAYAPGASKEWRLGAAMHAVVSSLEPASVSSISLLISPTTPTAISRATQRTIDTRYIRAPAWEKWLQRFGLIAYPGTYCDGDTRVSLSTVSLQGLSYQAAQYISKIAAAETYAVYGIDELAGSKSPVTVSANVAGVTRTRSLSHPLFCAAFEGAPKFGVRIFDPATTRALNGALMLHDLLNPEAPGAAARQPGNQQSKATRLLSQQVHGGIYTLPYVLEEVIRIAAAAALISRPGLLFSRSSSARPARGTRDLAPGFGPAAE